MARTCRTFCLLALLATLLGALGALPAHASDGAGLRQLQAMQFIESPAGRTPRTSDGTPAWPYRWDNRHTVDGDADFWFELQDLQDLQAREGPQALLIPRVGHAFRIWLDGQLLVEKDAPDRRYLNLSHRPRWLILPDVGPGPGRRHVLQVRIHALAGTNSGLAGVWIGPQAQIEDAHDGLWFRLVYGTLAVATASIVMGMLGLVMWRSQRESCYLWYVVAEWTWSARLFGYVLSERTWLPWPWSNALASAGYSLSLGAIGLFSLALIGQSGRRWRRVIVAWTLASMIAAVLINATGWQQGLLPWRTSMLAFAGVLAAAMVRAVRAEDPRGSRTGRVLLLACAIALLTGARDWYVLTFQRQNYDTMPWIPAAWVLFGLALLWVVGERLQQARLSQAAQQTRLSTELARQQSALSDAFEVERRHVHRRAADQERQRILQDMHDGLGSELLAALQLARHPDEPRETVAQQIEQALQQLKLSVDALQEGAQDIATLLGLLRHRLTPRLQAAGITLEWSVDALPAPQAWRTADARDLQLLVHEVFNNLFQHARAGRASLEARLDPSGPAIVIRILDDGIGLARPRVASGQGLNSLQVRADRLGAHLTIGNRTDGIQGLCTVLRIPLQRGARGA